MLPLDAQFLGSLRVTHSIEKGFRCSVAVLPSDFAVEHKVIVMVFDLHAFQLREVFC